ncbi:MAG: hypothetical protein JO108_35140 [Acidobacteriaceae bacterium]|nr:hypothetical protein [Acidobacteriaceae bacterium]
MNVRNIALLVSITLLTTGCRANREQTQSAVEDGSVLQANSSKKVYLINAGHKHYIQTPATLRSLDVVEQLKTVPDSVLDSIPDGVKLPDLTTRMVQKASTGQVFFLEKGKRRYVPDGETLKALDPASAVRGLPDDVADAIPLGSPEPHISGTASPPATK